MRRFGAAEGCPSARGGPASAMGWLVLPALVFLAVNANCGCLAVVEFRGAKWLSTGRGHPQAAMRGGRRGAKLAGMTGLPTSDFAQFAVPGWTPPEGWLRAEAPWGGVWGSFRHRLCAETLARRLPPGVSGPNGESSPFTGGGCAGILFGSP
jgi:hypothetical protein